MGLDTMQILTIIGMPAFTIPIITIGLDLYNKRKAKKKQDKELRLSLDDSHIREGAMPNDWKRERQNLREDKHEQV